MRRLLCGLLAAALLLSTCGCGSGTGTGKETMIDDNYRTYCEIFVRSYCDSNGDGIGDLAGLTGKLDYLADTGFTGVWLMPICKSPSYHKYDVTDYCSVDPQYGSMRDFENFVKECHRRHIRVLLDFVMNHTSVQHPWFQQAAAYLKTLPKGAKPDFTVCPYAGYYNFHPAVQPQANDQRLEGTEWAYEGVFGAKMPDLNLGNPAVRREMEKAAAFWLQKGADGFRLDAAKEYYSGSTEKNIEVLHWFQTYVKSQKKNAYLVAEVWDTLPEIVQYYKSGIDSVFNYPYGDSSGQIIKTLNSGGNVSTVQKYGKNLVTVQDLLMASNPEMIDAPFLSNHDVGRIASFVSGDKARCKMAAAMNLTMGGSAFVYYGEELGMKGVDTDPDKRAPMVWNTAGTGMTQPPPGCTVEQSGFGSLEQQKNDTGSIYAFYRRAIALREKYPEISRGKVSVVPGLSRGSVCAVQKKWDGQTTNMQGENSSNNQGEKTCILLYNLGRSSAQVSLDSAGQPGLQLRDSLTTSGEVDQQGRQLTLPPLSVAVLA